MTLASKKSNQDCALELKGTGIDRATADSIAKINGLLSPEEETNMFLRNDVIAALDNKMELVRRKAYDKFISDTLITKYMENGDSYADALTRFSKDVYGRNSMDTERRYQRATLLNSLDRFTRMFGVPEEANIRKIEASSEQERKLHNYIMDIADDIDTDTLTPAKAAELVKDVTDPLERMAYSIHAYNSYTRKFMHNSGVPVERTKGFVITRRYDSATLAKHGKDKYVADFKERLDWDKTLGKKATEKDIEKYLTNTFNKMKENNLYREYGQGTINAEIQEGKWKSKRDFIFKDADSAYAAFDEYSVGSLAQQIENGAWAMASESVKISRLGYNPTKNVERIMKDITSKSGKSPEEYNKVQRSWNAYKFNRITQGTMDIAGTNSYAAGALTNLSTFAKTVTAVGKLGNAITVAMLDPIDVMRQVYYINGSVMEGLGAYGEWHVNMIKTINQAGLKGILKGDLSAMQEMGEHLGMVTSFLSSESSMRVAKGELASDSSVLGKGIDKYGNTAMKMATFLPQQTALSKMSTAVIGARQFTKLLDKVGVDGLDLGKLNKWEKDTLKEYGLGAIDLKLLKEVDRVEVFGGAKFLSGKQIRDHFMFPKEGAAVEDHMEKMAKKMGVTIEQVGEASIALAGKYESFTNDFVTRGTPTPELSAKTALFKGTDKESMNVAMGLITQFMDTPVAQLQSFAELVEKSARVNAGDGKTKAEVLGMVGADVVKQAIPHVMLGMGSFLAYDAVWSAMAGKESYTEKFANGDRTKQNEIALDLIGRTSVVPFMAEFLNNATSVYQGGNASDMIGGPSVDLIGDALSTVNPNNERATLGKFLKKQLPNAMYIQAVKNRME